MPVVEICRQAGLATKPTSIGKKYDGLLPTEMRSLRKLEDEHVKLRKIMGDRFLLHGGVHHNPFEIFGLDRSAAVRRREALSQQRGDLLLT
jgi:hypothetical protein